MMNNRNFVFTPLEAAVIRKFDFSGLILRPELGVSFGMTPSQVDAVVKKLENDGIIVDSSSILLKLTKDGRKAQKLLDNKSDQVRIVVDNAPSPVNGNSVTKSAKFPQIV